MRNLIEAVLKQAAIEEGRWTEKRDAKGSVGMSEIMAQLNAGRQRVAEATCRSRRRIALFYKTDKRICNS